MAEPAVQKTMRLPLDVNKRLEEEAQRTGKKQVEIILAALEAYLKNSKGGKDTMNKTFYGIYNESLVHAFPGKESRDNWVSENPGKHRAATTSEPLVKRAVTVDKENRPTEYGGLYWHE